MSDRKRRYPGLAVVVDYDGERCVHVGECLRGLPAVFDTSRRPWVLPDAAAADAVAAVVQRCPSGALHFVRTDGGANEAPPHENTITPRPNGALFVRGRVQLRSADGSRVVDDTRLSLCRCGKSRNKPYCDNSHRASGFRDPGHVNGSGAGPLEAGAALVITASKNGPLLVEGALRIESPDGTGRWLGSSVELCRCGGSRTKPFCDGTHESIGFESE